MVAVLMNHFIFHAAHVVIHLAWMAATTCFGADVWGNTWTGVRINVGSVFESINGTSTCGPCNAIAGDSVKYVIGTNWRLGTSEFSNGKANHVCIVKAIRNDPTPYVEVVINGKVTERHIGYFGNVGREVFGRVPGAIPLR